MSEILPPAEEPQIERARVVEVYKKLANRGFDHPDDLPLDDPEVMLAEALMFSWGHQQQSKAKKVGTIEADLEYAIDRSMIYIDAGFDNFDYMKEVKDNWLEEDLRKATAAGLIDLASRIKLKQEEIKKKLDRR